VFALDSVWQALMLDEKIIVKLVEFAIVPSCELSLGVTWHIQLSLTVNSFETIVSFEE
jgi:hypothetical protein